MSRHFAITEWLGPLVVVEVDPTEFDGAGAVELRDKLEQHFRGVNVSLITPDWEAESGIRVAGLDAPADVLASPDLVWRDLSLPDEPEVPF